MPKPNIIWIYCDELRTDALGCYGNPHAEIETPNIDWIAQAGTRFANSFCSSPVCVPSRMSTMTGLYPEDTGVYHNEAFWPNFALDRSYLTFPEVFASHGYVTADLGKLHIPRQLVPWQHRNGEGGGMRVFYDDVDRDALQIIQLPGVPTQIGGTYPGDRPYPPEKLTQNALQWLQTAQAPYLVRLSYLQPHTPVFPRPPYDTLYQGAAFLTALRERGSPSAFERQFAAVQRADEMTPEQVHLVQVYYYGLVSWLDSQVGQILDLLRTSGQIENTILVFGADHGASLGENGCYAKHTFAPQVHRVPLLIAWPGTLPDGQVREDINEGLDLPRTLFGLCGIDTPAQFRGHDLFTSQPPEAVYATIGYGYPHSRAFPNLATGEYVDGRGWPRRACVRTADYRLDKNVRIDGRPALGAEEDVFLADVRTDPGETVNLADDPAHQGTVQRLSAMLDEHIAGGIEPPAEYVQR
jgi:choline-sulfatase